MPTGYARLAVESIPGNETNSPTLSTKKLFPPLQRIAPKPGTSPMERDDELRNQDEPLAVLTDRYNPTWEYGSRMYPDTIGFFLWLTLGAPVSTAGNGVITDLSGATIPAGATRHTWDAPFGPTGASPLTAQVDFAYKDQSVFYKGKGMTIDTLNIETPEDGGAVLSASGPGLYLADQTDPALTATYEALTVQPFKRGGLTLPTNLTGTGTTEDFSISVSNPVEPSSSLGVASKWADVMEKSSEGGPIVVSGSIPKRQLDQDDVLALKNATGFALLASWVSDSIIASAYPYKVFAKMDNCQYVDGDPDDLMNRRRHGHALSWKSTTTSTGSSHFQVVNATASYT